MLSFVVSLMDSFKRRLQEREVVVEDLQDRHVVLAVAVVEEE